MIDFDVLVVGSVGVDTIVHVPELAVPPGDLLPIGPIHDYVAHSGNGVALGYHALGLRTKFVSSIGDDAQGHQILARYADVGLDFSYLPAPAGTPRSVNLVDPAGRRFSFHDGRDAHERPLPVEFFLPYLERAGHVHVGGGLAVAAYAQAQRLGIATSTDLHAWDGVRPWANIHAREADVVFVSAAAVPDRIDDLMHAILEGGRAQLVVATEGEAGCRVLARAEPIVRRFPPAVPPRPVVDSNGAGDAFSTAFMSRWLNGRPIEECVLAGTVSGAFACGAPGTHEELITEAQLAVLMRPAVAAPDA
jgi:sugar/nucleoside kinase (ribokinase family)